jgi:hypothetical protein
MRQDPTLAAWKELGERLAGYFAARARGLLTLEYVLSSRSGERFGRLRVHGPEGAELEVGSTRAEIERTARSRYRMLTGDAQALEAEPARGAADALKVSCEGRLYEARIDLLRNTAVARYPGGGEAARILGGLTNRGYRADFDAADEGALPVAFYLLYHTAALRRRAFLARGGEDPDL